MDQRNRWQSYCAIGAATAVISLGAACSQSVDREPVDQEPNIESDQTAGPDELNEPPVADFEVDADLPESGDPVSFDASASTDPDGDDLTYAWRFGDETPGGGEMISHIYTDGGDFEVTLTVADEDGATDSATETVSIKDTSVGEGEAEVTIMVRDLDFADLDGVRVSPIGRDVTETTGDDGRATFENMPTGDPLVFEATKDGYAKQITRIRLPESTQTAPILIRMQPIGEIVEVDAIEEGGEVEGYDGARLDFPPEAVVDADGDPVTGAIEVEFTTFDVSDRPEIDGFPGAFLGLRPDGNIDPILSFGAMEVNLKQNGEDLQIKPGKTVEMDIPAYTDGIPMDADIPVWSLDESTGIWVDEGDMRPVESKASPTNRALRTEVTHFTTWNGDYPLTTPCKMKPKCTIVDPKSGVDAPLKSGSSCQVKVTSSTLPGLGNNCSTPEANVSGRQCETDDDCMACDAPGTDVDSDICTSDSDCKVCENASSSYDSANGEACSSSSDCDYQVPDGKECFGGGSGSCSSDSDCDYEDCETTCDPDGTNCTTDCDTEYGDCEMTYRTEYGDCNPKTCRVPNGLACDTSNLPGGQSIPGEGVCKDNSQCQGVQFCSTSANRGSASGQCALPGSGGVFAGATGRFNETFTVDPKGDYESGEGNPESDQGWLWVPNKDLHLRGRARDGALHGATNVSGHEEANKEFKDGEAVTCKEARPVIPLRHECDSGLSGLNGRCPELRARHFCEMIFKCPESQYSRSFTKTLGTPNVQECIEKFENDFDIPLLEEAIRSDRASFNGNRAASCLDRVAALRAQINEASGGAERRNVCAVFDRVALEYTACTGVEGRIGEGDACVHDLECRDINDKLTQSCTRSHDNACLGTCEVDAAAERRCGDGEICNYGQFCDSGFCREKRTGIGDYCDAANECSAGLYCNLADGECQERDFVASPGGDCSRGTSCALGLQCMPDGTGGQTCAAFSGAGGNCIGQAGAGKSGCMWDTYCTGTTCTGKKTHGANCEADHECMSGICQRSAPQTSGSCFGPQQPMSCP